MKKVELTAHMLVKNEENWIWYAIESVLSYVDKILIFDTGSTDQTARIIRSINSNKIIFEEKGNTDRSGLVNLRNEMVEKTKTDWFLQVDGDEVWPSSALKEVVETISKSSEEIWGLVVRTRNCVFDVWHYQPESAGKYEFLGRKGHLTVRAYRKLSGYSWQGEYPLEAYCNQGGVAINMKDNNLQFVDVAYWHLTHLTRSSKPKDVIDRIKKHKLEVGIKAKKEELPEVFFANRPPGIPSPFIKLPLIKMAGAVVLTPLRFLKRKLKQ